RLLSWTANNLADGDLSRQLPAWQWGRAADGQWRVLDANAASDADVWMAYALVEAARRWKQPRYAALGRALAARILATETARLPGLGLMLLPGPVGFHPAAGQWRLNPSYLPVPVLRGLASALAEPAWGEIAESAVRLLTVSAPHGFAPDWLLYDARHGVLSDTQSHGEGSYNAIRVYLWVAMINPADPSSVPLKLNYAPVLTQVMNAQAMPERVDAGKGTMLSAQGPAGFAQAVLPLLDVLADSDREHRFVHLFRQHVEALPVEGYYNQVLRLFSQLWLQGRYRFAADGSLMLSAPGECS
ncbi:MAG: cellulose synthase complex periplasmic endoglucanase BcsZ, partial [Perlucidibaca sp.]